MSRIKPVHRSPQLPKPPTEDWEIKPYDDEHVDFALWINRTSYSTLSGKYLPNEPYVALANQSDPNEVIELRTTAQVDELMDRLMRARAWIADRERID